MRIINIVTFVKSIKVRDSLNLIPNSRIIDSWNVIANKKSRFSSFTKKNDSFFVHIILNQVRVHHNEKHHYADDYKAEDNGIASP